jgi:hypothetical protein
LATARRPFKLHDFLRLHAARAAVLVIAAATLLALTGARSAEAPVASPPTADFDRLAQAPSDQPTNPYLEDDEEEPEDTLNVAPPPAVLEQQAAPDTTIPAPTSATQQAPPDTLPMASPDTLNLVPPGATADSTAAQTPAGPDTLFAPSILPSGPPGTQSTPPSTGPIGPKEAPKKPRTGILGVHPIAILLGLAALHIAVTHLVD